MSCRRTETPLLKATSDEALVDIKHTAIIPDAYCNRTLCAGIDSEIRHRLTDGRPSQIGLREGFRGHGARS